YYRHKYWQCKKTFMPQRKPWTRSQYGNGLMRFLVFLTIDLQMSQRAAKRLLDQFFGLNISRGSTGRLKDTAAEFYGATYKQILCNLIRARGVHIDETKVNLNGQTSYGWVLGNHEDDAYCR